MNYIDLHTHYLQHNSDVVAIHNVRAGNAFNDDLGSAPISFGIHPWDCGLIAFSDVLLKVSTFKHLYAIGECGLDKNASATIEFQKKVFLQHVELSETIHKPLIIHCVGLFNDIIDLKKKLNSSQPWIIHGFMGHPQLASQLIREDFILSFGESIFKPESKSAESLRMLPSGTFFFETDEGKRSIHEIYAQASMVRREEVFVLKDLLYNQFKALF